jgi:hypothetical protein
MVLYDYNSLIRNGNHLEIGLYVCNKCKKLMEDQLHIGNSIKIGIITCCSLKVLQDISEGTYSKMTVHFYCDHPNSNFITAICISTYKGIFDIKFGDASGNSIGTLHCFMTNTERRKQLKLI